METVKTLTPLVLVFSNKAEVQQLFNVLYDVKHNSRVLDADSARAHKEYGTVVPDAIDTLMELL